jgi:hypothetical protein
MAPRRGLPRILNRCMPAGKQMSDLWAMSSSSEECPRLRLAAQRTLAAQPSRLALPVRYEATALAASGVPLGPAWPGQPARRLRRGQAPSTVRAAACGEPRTISEHAAAGAWVRPRPWIRRLGGPCLHQPTGQPHRVRDSRLRSHRYSRGQVETAALPSEGGAVVQVPGLEEDPLCRSDLRGGDMAPPSEPAGSNWDPSGRTTRGWTAEVVDGRD